MTDWPGLATSFALVILLGAASPAFAHGEQVLFLPAAGVVLLLLTVVVSTTWKVSRFWRGVLFAIVLVSYAAQWLGSMATTTGGFRLQILAMIFVPLVAAQIVYVAVRHLGKAGSSRSVLNHDDRLAGDDDEAEARE